MAIAVSETGRVSAATGGNIELDVPLDRLRELLFEYFGPVVVRPSQQQEPLRSGEQAAEAEGAATPIAEEMHAPSGRETT